MEQKIDRKKISIEGLKTTLSIIDVDVKRLINDITITEKDKKDEEEYLRKSEIKSLMIYPWVIQAKRGLEDINKNFIGDMWELLRRLNLIEKELIEREKYENKPVGEMIKEKARKHYESSFLKNGKKFIGGMNVYWEKTLGMIYDDFAKKLHKELVEEIKRKYKIKDDEVTEKDLGDEVYGEETDKEEDDED